MDDLSADASMEYSDENIPTSCRVKLYQLESEGIWLDQGTGFVACSSFQAAEGPCMAICREDDGTVMLQSRIVLDDVYERQGESIIMWRETGLGWGQDIDYAISFQDSSGCCSVWEYICFVREHFRPDEEGYYDDQSLMQDQEGGMLNRSGRVSSFQLPEVSEETLPDIVDQFATCSTSRQKRMAAHYIVGHNYDLISNLVALSSHLAQKEDFSACGRVSDVMKQIAYLNDLDIINYLVSDEVIGEVAGVWEYDAALRHKESYKAFLLSPAASPKLALSGQSFAEGDDVIAFLATKLFRLRYMKDVMLRPLIDEGGAGALANAVQTTTIELCERIFGDFSYLSALLSRIEGAPEPTPSEPSRHVKTATFSAEPPNEHYISPNSETGMGVDDQFEKGEGLRRAGSGVSTSTLSTVSAASTMSPSPSPSCFSSDHKSTSNLSSELGQANIESSHSTSETEVVTPVTRPSISINNGNGSAAVSKLTISMQRMLVASSSTAPVDNNSSQCNSRGGCLKFLRELFCLSRNLTCQKRAELYCVFLDGVRSSFFNAMLEVLRCGPSIEWIMGMNIGCNDSNSTVPTCISNDEFALRQEERDRETYHRLCAMEILSTLTCVCPNALRSFVLEGPIPKPIIQGVLFGGLGVMRRVDDGSEIKKYPINTGKSFEAKQAAALSALRKHNSKCLLYVIIARLLAETNEMVMEHIGDILHSIIDPECRTDSVVDRERFAVAVNDCYLPWLLACFLEPYQENYSIEEGNVSFPPMVSTLLKPYLTAAVYYSSMRVICETLCFCSSALGYRIKYFILRNQLVSKVLSVLFGCGQKVVYLHAIKFIFAIVKTKDDMNFKQWTKLDILKPMFELMVTLSSRDNLLLSAIIELIDYIRSENIKVLIEYIVEKHSDCFANVVYQGETFEKLSTKYAQIKDQEDDILNRASGFPQNLRESVESTRKMIFNMQDAEESYFQDDDSDDDVQLFISTDPEVMNGGSHHGPMSILQGYGDDNDAEYGPMPAASDPRPSNEQDCGLSDDMFDDSVDVGRATKSSADRKNKKRRLSSIGFAAYHRPDKVRHMSDDDAIFPGVGTYIPEKAVSNDATGHKTDLEIAPTAFSTDHPVGPVDDDEAPPLPPLRSKYDSSSDEEDNVGISGDKNFLNSLFRRTPSGSSSGTSDDSTSLKSGSSEVL